MDTSVASLFLDDRAVTSGYARILRGYRQCLPAAAYGELRQGALNAGWGGIKLQELSDYLMGTPLLPATRATAEYWAHLRVECRRLGIGNTENDAWMAATALDIGCPLVSNDRIHLLMQAAVPDLQVLSLLTP